MPIINNSDYFWLFSGNRLYREDACILVILAIPKGIKAKIRFFNMTEYLREVTTNLGPPLSKIIINSHLCLESWS